MLIESYYGSFLALLGRDAIQPLERAGNAQKGLDALDRAGSRDPNQKEIKKYSYASANERGIMQEFYAEMP